MTRNDDVIAIARTAQRDDDWQALAPRTRTSILRSCAHVLFGTSEQSGIADDVRLQKRLLIAGGALTLALQIVSTLQLQEPIKHAIVLLAGGH